jgi:AcrR family transcriptional regulator
MAESAAPLSDAPPGMSRREAAKGARRARVVDAARQLLREGGVEALSVKAVAARAGVSLSTIYNLFASKDAILTGVYDQDLLTFGALVSEARSADALERIFDALDIAAELYRADPAFYRAIMGRGAGGAPNAAREAWLEEPRMFWSGLLAQAVEEELLRPGLDLAVLSVLMNQVLAGVVAHWISGQVTEQRFATEARFAYASLLSAFARGEAGLRLRKMIESCHRRLSAEPRTAGLHEDAA